jgi:hypothetical protein
LPEIAWSDDMATRREHSAFHVLAHLPNRERLERAQRSGLAPSVACRPQKGGSSMSSGG